LLQKDLLELISNVSASPLRYSVIEDSLLIDRIAIVGGSGISFLNDAIESGAQAFITADVSYHKFHEVFGKIMLIDPGHYEMEQFVSKGLAKLISKELLNETQVAILTSQVYTNPVRYFPNNINYENKQKNYLS
jgi:putative NIF3 family GTP cyclohydrolase 1 type 2